LQNFGDVGIFHFQLGLEIIFIFPLGGSRGGTWMKVRNTFIIFIVSGFWHGANWTFIVWGALNAFIFYLFY
jgi:D-alanyl-lipoteichoic acid acyltransferase DltB (MBOAT superfamily)